MQLIQEGWVFPRCTGDSGIPYSVGGPEICVLARLFIDVRVPQRTCEFGIFSLSLFCKFYDNWVIWQIH